MGCAGHLYVRSVGVVLKYNGVEEVGISTAIE